MRYKSDSKSGIIIDVTDKTSASYFRIVDKVVFINSQIPKPNRDAHTHSLALSPYKQKSPENDFRGLKTKFALITPHLLKVHIYFLNGFIFRLPSCFPLDPPLDNITV